MILDERGVLHASATLAEATGRAPSHLLTMRSWADLLHPADRPKLSRWLSGAGQRPKPTYVGARLLRSDGTTLTARVLVREVQTAAGRRLVVATFRRSGSLAPGGGAEPRLLEQLVAASISGKDPGAGTFELVGTRFGVAVDARTIDDFVDRLARVGLGILRVETRAPGQLVVASSPDGSVSPASCALRLGYLRAAATRISGEPALAAETWCYRRGDPHCRFVLQIRGDHFA